MNGYSIQKTGPTTYLGPAGNVITGFTVTVLLTEFQETHLINVPSLDPNAVKSAVESLLVNRKALQELGQSES